MIIVLSLILLALMMYVDKKRGLKLFVSLLYMKALLFDTHELM